MLMDFHQLVWVKSWKNHGWVFYGISGPVQTLCHSCAQPNWWIKYGKRAASESVWYSIFSYVLQKFDRVCQTIVKLNLGSTLSCQCCSKVELIQLGSAHEKYGIWTRPEPILNASEWGCFYDWCFNKTNMKDCACNEILKKARAALWSLLRGVGMFPVWISLWGEGHVLVGI